MSFSERISPLIGRWALAWFFLSAAWDRAAHWQTSVTLLAMQHFPVAPALLALALMVMILGGLSLAIGFHTRHGALLLFGFTVVVTLVMHNFWTLTNPAERAADFQLFAGNVAVAGALLILVGMGAGPFAFDNLQKKGKR
ncbi:MAG: DoxX family protein [Alphaproteobacteria bacterium]|nr:DoxX family protein [Alphaproteobacteria bacterium]MDE2014773.1 DoxX family protein [Alphaproteobacteria bacterium]MDE2073315.1 DoxX family protein [Alphaproteobacteria bacterium]MDE2352674.1 DoxX family protein [Alphaproteobacteria bacterium]